MRNVAGIPQMGAAVEIVRSATQSFTVFTDEHGFYTMHGLAPGSYFIRVTAPAFLPTLKESVSLRAGASTILNFTLSTLFDAVDLLPNRRTPNQDDDWKWVLRSSANRPVLRALPGAKNPNEGQPFRGELTLLAGGDGIGYGSSGLGSTGFVFEKSLFSSGTVSFAGNVGYGSSLISPATVLRTSYSQKMANGSRPEIALTMRHFAAPDSAPHGAALEALSLSVSDSITLGDTLELKFGEELQTVQFMRRVNAIQPFGSAGLHLSPNTVLEYRFATTVPNTRYSKGFDSAPADLSESAPRVSLVGGNPKIEKAQHHELSFSRRLGDTNLQIAAYHDAMKDAALTGLGDVDADALDALDDPYSSSFRYDGGRLSTNGLRMVVQHNWGDYLVGTLDYGYGGVLTAGNTSSFANLRNSLRVTNRQALTAKASGTAPGTKTKWIAAYKWTNGRALTPVDLFNTSAGQADPYFNLFLRQPIPGMGHRMEVLVDLRNLLAQGYVPVAGRDGHTVYLVQSSRTVRGGLSFSF